ncbi:hypothetical protein KIPB_012854, partial [Kipferlia bialata]
HFDTLYATTVPLSQNHLIADPVINTLYPELGKLVYGPKRNVRVVFDEPSCHCAPKETISISPPPEDNTDGAIPDFGESDGEREREAETETECDAVDVIYSFIRCLSGSPGLRTVTPAVLQSILDTVTKILDSWATDDESSAYMPGPILSEADSVTVYLMRLTVSRCI